VLLDRRLRPENEADAVLTRIDGHGVGTEPRDEQLSIKVHANRDEVGAGRVLRREHEGGLSRIDAGNKGHAHVAHERRASACRARHGRHARGLERKLFCSAWACSKLAAHALAASSADDSRGAPAPSTTTTPAPITVRATSDARARAAGGPGSRRSRGSREGIDFKVSRRADRRR
jgi:hypothetical protein